MNVEQVVVSIGELDKLLAGMQDAHLQESLKGHTDAMLRNIFDHCMQKNRASVVRKASVTRKAKPQSSKVDSVPSLADAAVRKLGGSDSVF